MISAALQLVCNGLDGNRLRVVKGCEGGARQAHKDHTKPTHGQRRSGPAIGELKVLAHRRSNSRIILRSTAASCVKRPWRYIPFCLPFGPPPRAP
jgi:hypothetical protein